MNFRVLFAVAFCALMLSACGPNLRTIGTVEDDKLITPAMIEEMGFEEFEKQYLGKEVTVTDIYQSKFTGGYRLEDGQCIFAVRNRDPKLRKTIVIYIYANHWPDFVIEEQFEKSNPEYRALLNYPEETDLPMDVCDEFCKYDEETGACFYKSPNLKITGKIFGGVDLNPLARQYVFQMKLKGVQY